MGILDNALFLNVESINRTNHDQNDIPYKQIDLVLPKLYIF